MIKRMCQEKVTKNRKTAWLLDKLYAVQPLMYTRCAKSLGGGAPGQ